MCCVIWDVALSHECPCSPAHANVFLCLQNVGLASSKQQHPVTSVSRVLPTPRGWTLELCFVPAWMVSTGPQQTPPLDHVQVTSPLDL